MQVAVRMGLFVANSSKNFLSLGAFPCSLSRSMHRQENTNSDFKSRVFYGGVVGAILGMIIGTMPTVDPRVALISMAVSAVMISGLAAFSDSFWESLRSAWELLRISFWRW